MKAKAQSEYVRPVDGKASAPVVQHEEKILEKDSYMSPVKPTVEAKVEPPKVDRENLSPEKRAVYDMED